jgi:hypothetical protein
MSIPLLWLILLFVLLAGFLGGAVGAEIAERTYPQKSKRLPVNALFFKNKNCGRVFATRLGNILLGGLSAVIFWGLYGPFTAFPVLGESHAIAQGQNVFLSLGDLVGSILVGTGGPTFLLTEARRRCEQNRKP